MGTTEAPMHVLFHRTTPWRGAIRGSTNTLASLFAARGHAVTYLEGTAHPGHLLRGSRYADSWRRGPRREAGAWVTTPFTPLPFAGRGAWATPAAADRAYRSARIPRLIRGSGHGDVDALWVARPGGSALGRVFPDATLAMQVVDYYPAFGGPHVRALEERDYARADLVVSIGHAVTDYLTRELGVPEARVLTLGQGVFAERYGPELAEPEALAALPRPRAVWVGRTRKLDPKLTEAAVAWLERAGGSLALVGEPTPWSRALASRHGHVALLGAIPPEQTPPLLVHADLGLMLYDQRRAEVYRGQHPLKLYEYAAAGLAVVSTPHDEYRWLKPPVVEARDAVGVARAMEQAWAERDGRRDAGRAFAARHDWRDKQARAEAALRAARRAPRR